MRAIACALLLCAVACGSAESTAPPTSVAPTIDRTPGPPPDDVLMEIALDGGDATLAALARPLPPASWRAALPTRLSLAIDGLLETPESIRSRVATDSPLRLVMARVDGETRSAIAVRLSEPIPSSESAPDGPRGARRVGERAAVDDRIAVIADDPVMLDRAFAYLAYDALDRPTSPPHSVIARVPASTLASTIRAALVQAVEERRTSLLASIAAARAVHDRPPELGDPEALVALLSDAAITRLGYLPDLGVADLVLAPTASGLALTLEADVTSASPLAAVLAGTQPIDSIFVAAMPTSAALAVAAGSTAVARAETAGVLAESLSSIGGARVSASERAALDAASVSIASIRGDAGAFAIGAADAGFYVIGATRGGTDASAPAISARTLPWTSTLLAALLGCASATRCAPLSIATARTGDVRTDVLGHGGDALAAPVRTALAASTAPSSPDLARDLAALDAGTFVIALVRPLRLLPLLSVLGGPPPAGLPRGDGAAVLAIAHESGRLRVSLRASTSAMADLDAVVRMFAGEAESE